jgi:hypothetical protein
MIKSTQLHTQTNAAWTCKTLTVDNLSDAQGHHFRSAKDIQTRHKIKKHRVPMPTHTKIILNIHKASIPYDQHTNAIHCRLPLSHHKPRENY